MRDEQELPRRPRIVLINDDRTFLHLMEALLQETEGYAVEVCLQWDDAYGFVKEQQQDLVILDIVLDREERGWTILELLTLDPQTRPIPVIVCSAAIHSLDAHATLLAQYGVVVLPKPFDLDTLLTQVQEALARGPR